MTKTSSDYIASAEADLDQAYAVSDELARFYLGRAQVYATLAVAKATQEAS